MPEIFISLCYDFLILTHFTANITIIWLKNHSTERRTSLREDFYALKKPVSRSLPLPGHRMKVAGDKEDGAAVFHSSICGVTGD
ncbi:MAG: hypothetical protein LBS96_01615 [Oscillospiraceae bacterium]|jgi:hypothetical protein|nr:hypothetical protein [Oscillospiraceae bacterium]